MEARTKYVPLLRNIPLTFVMTQASEIKNYVKANMYSIPRDARVGYWTQNIKRPILAKSCHNSMAVSTEKLCYMTY